MKLTITDVAKKLDCSRQWLYKKHGSVSPLTMLDAEIAEKKQLSFDLEMEADNLQTWRDNIFFMGLAETSN